MISLFKREIAKPKNKLYYIEIDDEELNKDLSSVIISLDQEIKAFKGSIDQTTYTVREHELIKLNEQLTECQKKVARIISDVKHIIDIKEHNLKYFTIKDDSFLQVKQDHLQQIDKEIHICLNILEQSPSATDLKNELLSVIINQLDAITKLTQDIVSQDVSLCTIYKKLMEV